jgi:predicted GIY-YIG superfamily endonuclease
MMQMLLLPDPRPLVERLGREFFRKAPQCPGVYLMRDGTGTVLYVGKAKNLRKRLASYRVANPERMPRRHLRLLRLVERIELEECASESSALARESHLLRSLRPRFNRAGTWPGPPHFLLWRVNASGLHLAIKEIAEAEWHSHGPVGVMAMALRTALVRLLWCAIHPERGLRGMPQGWFAGRHGGTATIVRSQGGPLIFEDCMTRLNELFAGNAKDFTEWVRARSAVQQSPFEVAVREADLETVTLFAERLRVNQ